MSVRRLAALLAVAILAAGCPRRQAAPGGGGPAGARKPRVTVAAVVKVPLAWTLETVGSVEAREEVPVAAGVPGIAGRVDFREGDDVTPETMLVTIDEERYELEARRARSDLAGAQADFDKATVTWRSRSPLHEQKIISDEELADLKAAVDRAQADKARAEATLGLAEKALRDCRVRPPIAGRINARRVSTGEYLKAETVVATIVDLSELHVRFAVPESDARRVVKGLKAGFVARVAAGEKAEAEIFWVSQVADSRTRTVECKARLAGSPAGLRPGMSGTVRLSLENPEGSLVAPPEAVLPTERGFVAFVLEGGKARERKLVPGIQTPDGRLEVVEGLKEGDTLIVRGAAALRDGQDVEVVK